LHRLGAAVHQHGLGALAVRQERGQLLAERDVRLVGGHVDAGVQELGRLPLDRAHDLVVAVPGAHHAEPAREVAELTAVGIDHAGPAPRDERDLAGEHPDAARDDAPAPFDHVPGAVAGAHGCSAASASGTTWRISNAGDGAAAAHATATASKISGTGSDRW